MTSTTPPTAKDRDDIDRDVSWAERCLIWAATGVILAAVLNSTPLQSANDRSRWATVWSLVERRTFQIDEIDANPRWSTIDKVRYRTSDSEPWHFYSSKPPLLSVIVAGLYAMERATLGHSLLSHTTFVTRLLLILVNVLPFWLMLRSLARTLILLQTSFGVRMFVLIAAGFGSLLNPYLTTLNNHTPAAVSAWFSISAAVRLFMSAQHTPESAIQTVRSTDVAALGFFAALTCCFELPAAQFGVIACFLSLILARRETMTMFLPAALIPLAAFFFTNWLVTGGAKPFYSTYGTETYEYVHDGIPSYWKNPKDLDANQETPLVYLFHCILGHHGLISLTPVLAVAVVGTIMIAGGWRYVDCRSASAPSLTKAFSAAASAIRFVVLCGAIMSLVTLSFYLTRTQNYNYGGNSVGLRWMLWLSPFWWISLVPALNAMRSRNWQILANLLLTASIFSANWSINRPWQASWLYEQMEIGGLINYRTPVKPFASARGAVLGRLPAPGTKATFESTDQQSLTLQMHDRDHIEVRFSNPGVSSKNTVLNSNVRLDLPRWQKSGVVRVAAVEGDSLVIESGLSGFSQHLCRIHQQSFAHDEFPSFQPTGERWVPSRSNPQSAWRVDRGVARVIEKSERYGDLMHRCEVWYCDEAPFGVIQWKTTVTSMATGDMIDAVTWTWTEL
ncbi:MAG: hypothetical protein ACK58L_04000 [Planctomycetota bacterium]